MVRVASDTLNSRVPDGPLQQKWDKHRFDLKLVNPANKRKFSVIVVGTGLAGGSAAASMAELGYNVKAFCFQDSPRRAHSIAAQGGINAAKNYQNDGDSIWRLFYDTLKGGDYRAREANVYRLAQVSNNIIDQCVAQGVPFAREYGGTLANRSFGGAQVSRTFYSRGQTGQQLLLGAYQAMMRQVGTGKVKLFARREMLELIVVDGLARGIVVRNLATGQMETHTADAVVLCTGGYGNVYYLSTMAKGCNVTAAWRCHRRGALFANPCYTQIHPTCIPVTGDYQSKLTLMSESLRNDGRVWVPLNKGDKRSPDQIPDAERDYYLERRYPSFGNLAPRDISSRAAKERCDAGHGVGDSGLAVFLDFRDAIRRDGEDVIRKKYGNLFHMYNKITAEDPYKQPMRIFPAVHYTMGGLWVDYNLMSNLPGLYVLGEANFSDHGANRLGASALMQGLSDGYFVLPYTIGDHLATSNLKKISDDHPACVQARKDAEDRISKLLAVQGKRTVDSFHRELGLLMWDKCGMARNKTGLQDAISGIRDLRAQYWKDVRVLGSGETVNASLEKAGRVADFMEFAELLATDALHREESCGGHFREEYQTDDGEAARQDDQFSYVGAWEFNGAGEEPTLHKEPLVFEKCEAIDQELQITMSNHILNLNLRVWRQAGPKDGGAFKTYRLNGVSTHMSFLEMLDVLNEQLISQGELPVEFDHDCREGICGMCSLMINGQAHGPDNATTTCQLHMRRFSDGDTITIEPWRSSAFPVLRDLVVDRSAFDRIISAGGFVSVNTGNAPDGNAIPVPGVKQEVAMDGAACIGCGACVAACKNASAMLFVSAKVSQLAVLPQGHPERNARVLNMVAQMDKEGFGSCTNTNECEAACPAEVSVAHIARLNREYLRASIFADA